ncbi:MAG: DUF268 domain-containing protein [Synergistaceae bacterium]|nr:DUF268 domain-containing protein [Synergistaceae bacterium]
MELYTAEAKIDDKFNEIERKLIYCKKIIIWGATLICVKILNYLHEKYSGMDFLDNITIWDKVGHGGSMYNKKYIIQFPDMHNLCGDIKKNACVILAFNSESSYDECTQLLLNNDFKNIVHGRKYMEHISVSNILRARDEYNKLNTDPLFAIDENNINICTSGLFQDAGTSFNDLYLNQDLWCAQKIFDNPPKVHYDIGSSVNGFITHLLSFKQKVVLIDIRNLELFNIPNISFIREDATLLSGIENDSIESFSALCSLEHFGLGMYGDPIDPNAHINAFKSIQRVLKNGGNAYISVPVSKHSYLRFNECRVYSPQYIIDQFRSLKLVEFSCVQEFGEGLQNNVSIDTIDDHYYYGLFHFCKGNSA